MRRQISLMDQPQQRRTGSEAAQTALRIGLMLLGPFLLGTILVWLGIAFYVWLWDPPRFAVRLFDDQPPRLIMPQPREVSPAELDVRIKAPSPDAYLNGAITNAAVWVNGKAFPSGAAAARDLVRTAGPLWLTAGAGVGLLLLLRRPK
jgi:hypothetical protein